jgi:hypothetical protein
MAFRIVLAGIVGGVLTFVMGAVNHMALELTDTKIHRLPDEEAFLDALRAQKLAHGIYGFPKPAEGQPVTDEAWAELSQRYKAGPNGMLIVGRTGEEPMSAHELGSEAATNVMLCLFAAWIVSRFDPRHGFIVRWLAVVVMGVIGWLSLTASYGIWYRFHSSFVHDELYCSLIETAVAGLAIAAIVRPKPAATTTVAAGTTT